MNCMVHKYNVKSRSCIVNLCCNFKDLTMNATRVSDTASPLTEHSWTISLIKVLITASVWALDIAVLRTDAAVGGWNLHSLPSQKEGLKLEDGVSFFSLGLKSMRKSGSSLMNFLLSQSMTICVALNDFQERAAAETVTVEKPPNVNDARRDAI